ncbi:hypothetical protein AVEN_141240-1 [Araneus ventricosus]|uniref:Uncharacterized protein n=1 Tax=Araneus ventricosus TaxID=182803 RepID=A0A4Y2SWL8_ARAVE|nr:hypothetical protein AVEN_141240-1 [Araneus ventricosus]
MEVNKKVDTFLRQFTGRDFPTVFPEPFPLGIRLPINCDEDIDRNNKFLDTGSQTTLIRHLHAEGIEKSSSFLSSIIKILLSPNVTVSYSRLGRKGKKPYMELEQVFKAILTTASLKFPKSSKEELAEIFCRALFGASDWEGRRSRPSGTSTITECSSFLNTLS